MLSKKFLLIIALFVATALNCTEEVPVLIPGGLAALFWQSGYDTRYSQKTVQAEFQRCGLGQADPDTWGEYAKGGKKFVDVMGQIDRQAREAGAKAKLGSKISDQIYVYNKTACAYVGLTYEKDDKPYIAEKEASTRRGITEKIQDKLYHLGSQLNAAQTKVELENSMEALVLSELHSRILKQHEVASRDISRVDDFLYCINIISRRQNFTANDTACCLNSALEPQKAVFDEAIKLARKLEKTAELVALNECKTVADLLQVLEQKQLDAERTAANPIAIIKAGIDANSDYPEQIKSQYAKRAEFYRCFANQINNHTLSMQTSANCKDLLHDADQSTWIGTVIPKRSVVAYERVTKLPAEVQSEKQ